MCLVKRIVLKVGDWTRTRTMTITYDLDVDVYVDVFVLYLYLEYNNYHDMYELSTPWRQKS